MPNHPVTQRYIIMHFLVEFLYQDTCTPLLSPPSIPSPVCQAARVRPWWETAGACCPSPAATRCAWQHHTQAHHLQQQQRQQQRGGFRANSTRCAAHSHTQGPWLEHHGPAQTASARLTCTTSTQQHTAADRCTSAAISQTVPNAYLLRPGWPGGSFPSATRKAAVPLSPKKP
jgi:hypothetical protein